MGYESERNGLDFVSLRPATPEDAPFLLRVYAASRGDEMALVPWSDADKAVFLRQQFEAQDFHYRRYYPQAEFAVVVFDGEPIGRIYLSRAEFTDEIRLMDIALLPTFRGRGIGTQLIRKVMVEAATLGRGVRLHVEANNPARRLYDRLGFRFVHDEGPYVMLEWLPRVAAL